MVARAATVGKNVDLGVDAFWAAAECLHRLGDKNVPSRKAAAASRARAWRIEQSIATAGGARSSYMDHGTLDADEDDEDPIVQPQAGAKAGPSALCLGGQRRLIPRVC